MAATDADQWNGRLPIGRVAAYLMSMRRHLILALASALLAGALLIQPAGAAARPAIELRPARVEVGHAFLVNGTGFSRGTVTLLIGPPRSEASKVGSAAAGSNGRFSKRIRIARGATPGAYVVLACQRACRVKAQRNLRIVRG